MPEYVFEDVKTGVRVDVFMDASECVEIGKTIRHEGRRLRRLPSVGASMVEPNWGHVAYQFDEEDAKLAPRSDPATGCPVLLNKREIETFRRKIEDRDKKEGFKYDYGRFKR